jgi:hypothetical protein
VAAEEVLDGAQEAVSVTVIVVTPRHVWAKAGGRRPRRPSVAFMAAGSRGANDWAAVKEGEMAWWAQRWASKA